MSQQLKKAVESAGQPPMEPAVIESPPTTAPPTASRHFRIPDEDMWLDNAGSHRDWTGGDD